MTATFPATALAQATAATVSGTVADNSGAVVPGAQLTVKNSATGVSNTVTTNGAGFYQVGNLVPGVYEITTTANGFATSVQTGLTLEVGDNRVENVALKIGTSTEKVEVTAAAPTVELSNASIGAVVNQKSVVELPLNGRSWTDLVDLQPGASALTTQSHFDNSNDAAARSTKGYGAQTSIGGARPVMNNYHIDGISVNDYANGPPSDVTGQAAGVDAIQEFSVLTANYTAEYGMTSGGTINAVTKSGTNQIHGTAYEFIRNSVFDARNYFDPITGIPEFRRNQFGVSSGAPIRKNRTFIFANYEGMRQLQNITIPNIVPSAAARAGTLCSQPNLTLSATKCTPTTVAVNPNVTTYLNDFFPLPNAGLVATGTGDTGIYNFVDPQTAGYDFVTGKIDNKFSDQDSLTGSFIYERSPFTFPDNFNVNVTGYSDNYQLYSISETHTFTPNLVNNFRIGVFRQTAATTYISSPNPNATNTALGSQPGLDAARITVTGLASFFGGANGIGTSAKAMTNSQLYDDAFWVRGKHTIKFGFAAETQAINTGPGSGPGASGLGGTWTFASLSTFLVGQATTYKSATSILPLGGYSVEHGLRDKIFGGYVQDDWHPYSNLVINLGLRYEMSTNPYEVHGIIDVLPTMLSTKTRFGGPVFQTNPTLHNVDPRVGFALDPFHNGKTSIRGGFGFFDSMPLIYMMTNMSNNPPAYQTVYSASNPPISSFYGGTGLNLTGASNNLFEYYIDQNPHRTYLMQRNLSIQQEVLHNTTATISYVGSRGLHLPVLVGDADAIIPSQTPFGYLYPYPYVAANKINPAWGDIQAIYFSSPSYFDSLQAQVYKRMSHGLQIQGAFTWGKSIDTGSSTISQNDFSNALRDPLVYVNPSLSRGPSDFDVRRTAVINAIWEIPGEKSLHGVARAVGGGWQLGTIFKLSDGMPFTPTFGTGGNVAGFGNSASNQNDFPDRLHTGAGCNTAINKHNPIQYINVSCFTLPQVTDAGFYKANCNPNYAFPTCMNLLGNATRNSLKGPGQQDLDFSVYKNTPAFNNKVNFQFRAEAFNILNHTNFSPPTFGTGTDVFSSTGVVNGTAGTITYTSTSSRQMQFALKIIY